VNWWKVELDKSGAILTCEHVDAVAKGNRLLAFVQASTKAEACSAAKMWWAAQQAKRRAWNVSREARLLQAGLCKVCGRNANVTGRKRCEPCLARRRERDVQIYHGAPKLVERHSGEDAAMLAYQRQQREYAKRKNAEDPRCQLRWSALVEKFDALGPEAFRAWLASNIPEQAVAAE
jgi:hypothetical protein